MAFEPCVAIRCHVPASTMAEGRFQDDAEEDEGCRAPPPSNTRQRPEWEFCHNAPGFCPILPGMYRIGLGYSHDGVPSGVGTVVALSGGVVCGVERFH